MFRFVSAVAVMLFSSIAVGDGFKAGAGAVVITPEQDIWMSGYASRKEPSSGKVHDLFAKAIVFEDATGAKSAIVTTDLIGMTKAISDATAQIVNEKFGIPRERLMVTASHTHCGPALAGNLEAMFDLDAEHSARVAAYTGALPEKMAAAVEKAIAELTPVSLEWTQTAAGFAVNRRQYTLKGVSLGVNPIGPVDRSVPMIVARRADGTVKAVLFGYACHNTTLSFQQLSGDYAGFAQAHIEANSPGTTALFVSGCGGDANPNPRGTLELAQQHGDELGRAVVQALRTPGGALAAPIRAQFQEVALALSAPPTREQLDAQAADADIYIQRRAKRLLAEWDANGALAESKPYPVQVWQFGDGLRVVGLGGEVVVDYALRLKHEFGADKTFVIGYANDVMGYIPSLRVLREGGYEPETSNIYYGLYGPWAPTLEETIIGAVHELAGR